MNESWMPVRGPIQLARCLTITDPAKKTDTRQTAFVTQHGDVAVEFGALPADVLRARLVDEVEARLDLAALERVRRREVRERKRLSALLRGAG